MIYLHTKELQCTVLLYCCILIPTDGPHLGDVIIRKMEHLIHQLETHRSKHGVSRSMHSFF